MENAIKCPVCKGNPTNCSYCKEAGFVIVENGKNYLIELDSNNTPIKGALITDLDSKPAGILRSLFSENEPKDLIWFFKNKQQ